MQIPLPNDGYLQGSLLIATPNITDSPFHKSVILMCVHSAEGAMGIIVNLPLEELSYRDLFKELALPMQEGNSDLPIHYGGPVEANRGFVIFEHHGNFLHESLLVIGDIAVSGSLTVLRAIATNTGPQKSLLALGFAGWGAGQLEAEIEANSWISAPLDTSILFDNHLTSEEMWKRAAKLQGVDVQKLSTLVGHA
jgi:putative transcriptional regulator